MTPPAADVLAWHTLRLEETLAAVEAKVASIRVQRATRPLRTLVTVG